ncbi:MAG: glycosyl transferase [Novosphingobium sp. 17-62-19]|uniref:glycosyltransferase family 2 protein n=1 Tax=Novosphingobium sp. 17-62-19 TaxID=1970406 RepID=UPI000BD8829D|nr:glycosyltransferase family 2 protein [Novosphingobium sp. 17-62-19]OZA21540.1 MAG: glycosyl transferase [Novosphingobium sp. 17-62-19]
MNGFWLKAIAHLNAVGREPYAWLAALWSFILGKRLRARTRFDALLGATPQAYRLWLLDEPVPPVDLSASVPVVVLVEAGEGDKETLRCATGQGVPAFAIRDGAFDDAVDCIDWSGRPWFMLLSAGDHLHDNAIAAYRDAASKTGAAVIYADDDLIDRRGRRHSPHFKPSWNAELHHHFDYLAGACMVRINADDLAQAISSNGAGSGWAAALLAAALASDGPPPVRIPHVLHHRRKREDPVVPHKLESLSAPLPKVTVIVPTRNRLDLLSTCIGGLERTEYPDFEVIIVDNGSDDPATLAWLANLDNRRFRVLRDDGAFNFSRLNNRAAQIAGGDVLCLLNNDIEIVDTGWLTAMVQQALRPEVGAVGAQLLYPDGRIQHAGVVLGICGGAAHAHRFLWPDDTGYFRRHALPQFVSAVTAACLVVRRSCFEAVGGLDEERFAVAFNDVDFCMRLNARGWQSLYEPRAMLIHHESVSRGFDRDPVGVARFAAELEALKKLWGTGDFTKDVDPFHHPQLSRYSELFAVRAGGD